MKLTQFTANVQARALENSAVKVTFVNYKEDRLSQTIVEGLTVAQAETVVAWLETDPACAVNAPAAEVTAPPTLTSVPAAAPTTPVVEPEKPRRVRRTKAQIEADKAAAAPPVAPVEAPVVTAPAAEAPADPDPEEADPDPEPEEVLAVPDVPPEALQTAVKPPYLNGCGNLVDLLAALIEHEKITTKVALTARVMALLLHFEKLGALPKLEERIGKRIDKHFSKQVKG